MYGQRAYLYDREMELQIQLGSKPFPEYPMKSFAEQFSQLRKCLGIASSPVHSFHMRPLSYRTRNFIVGMDMERVLQAGYTGHKSGGFARRESQTLQQRGIVHGRHEPGQHLHHLALGPDNPDIGGGCCGSRLRRNFKDLHEYI